MISKQNCHSVASSLMYLLFCTRISNAHDLDVLLSRFINIYQVSIAKYESYIKSSHPNTTLSLSNHN